MIKTPNAKPERCDKSVIKSDIISKQLERTFHAIKLQQSPIKRNIQPSSSLNSLTNRSNKKEINPLISKGTIFRMKRDLMNQDSFNHPTIYLNKSCFPLTSKGRSHITSLFKEFTPNKGGTISKEMANKFLKETLLMKTNKLSQFKNYHQVRKKIINDFQENANNDYIQISKQNYNQTLLFLELNHLNEVKKSKQFEKQFYQMKKSNSYFGSKRKLIIKKKNIYDHAPNDSNLSYSMSRKNYFRNKHKQIVNDMKEFSKELMNIACEQYEPLNHKTQKLFEKINMNNLQRKIKIFTIDKYRFDIDNDDLHLKNIPKLKELVKESEKEVIHKLRKYTPVFMKTNFRSKTLNRFKAASGNNFGIP